MQKRTLRYCRNSKRPPAIAIQLLYALLLAGCSAQPTYEDLLAAPFPHDLVNSEKPIRDERAAFRQYFCASLKSVTTEVGPDGGCDYWLHRMDGESPASPMSSRPAVSGIDVWLVTGAFSECLGEHALPFRSAIEDIDGAGHRFETIIVGGRSGSRHNATQIAEFFEQRPVESERRQVLIGYSKGANDILQYISEYPEQAHQVDAVVSIAGSVYGSPLANMFDGPYHLLFSHLPNNRCEKGDRELVHSLRTDVRNARMNELRLPEHIKYYSIAAFTTRDRLARSLVPTWKLLLKHDIRNDGQILARDSLIPGSALLGYLNADHWAVALDIEKELEFLAHRKSSRAFPQTALLGAILEYVGAELAFEPATELD